MRADVAELLAAGVSARAIARDLGVPIRRVHAARRELGLPPCRPGPLPAASLREAFEARTCPTPDGHRRWVARSYRGLAVMWHGGRRYTARQAGFWLHTGRRAVGNALPGCGVDWCVEPAHQDDALARARLDADFVAVFGEAAGLALLTRRGAQ